MLRARFLAVPDAAARYLLDDVDQLEPLGLRVLADALALDLQAHALLGLQAGRDSQVSNGTRHSVLSLHRVVRVGALQRPRRGVERGGGHAARSSRGAAAGVSSRAPSSSRITFRVACTSARTRMAARPGFVPFA